MSTQTNPRGLTALVPSGTVSRCLLPGAARAAASSCAPCALNSLQRSSAPIMCPPLRLVGAEREGLWPLAPCEVTEVGYEPCRVQRICQMGYLGVCQAAISAANFLELRVCELRRMPKRRSSQNSPSGHFGE